MIARAAVARSSCPLVLYANNESGYSYYDNVGGKILDMAIQRIATNGKIVACGAISTYERGQNVAVSAESWIQIVSTMHLS